MIRPLAFFYYSSETTVDFIDFILPDIEYLCKFHYQQFIFTFVVAAALVFSINIQIRFIDNHTIDYLIKTLTSTSGIR